MSLSAARSATVVSAPIDDAVRALLDPRETGRSGQVENDGRRRGPFLELSQKIRPSRQNGDSGCVLGQEGGRLLEGRDFPVAIGDHFASFRFRAASTLAGVMGISRTWTPMAL